MLRKAVVVVAIVAAIAVALYAAGLRIALDGSGMFPRFVSSAPDYDALEADRARQRTSAPQQSAAATALQRRRTLAPSAAPPPPDASGESIPRIRRRRVRRMAVWPDFRGPARDGRSAEAIRTDWPRRGLPQLWKQPIGLGYASFVVAGGRAFTIEQRRATGSRGRVRHRHRPRALDATDGTANSSRRWAATARARRRRITTAASTRSARSASCAVSTPRTGTLVWRRNILDDNARRQPRSGACRRRRSIVDDKVIVLPGGSGGRSVVAYNKATGDADLARARRSRRRTCRRCSSRSPGVRQVLIVSATRAVGLDPADGTLLWEYPWPTGQGINVAQPVLLGGDRVFLSASYGQGAAVFEVAPRRRPLHDTRRSGKTRG